MSGLTIFFTRTSQLILPAAVNSFRCCVAGAKAMLQQCEGIGAVTAAKICGGWAAGRSTRAAEKFLHDMGLTMAQAHQVQDQLPYNA